MDSQILTYRRTEVKRTTFQPNGGGDIVISRVKLNSASNMFGREIDKGTDSINISDHHNHSYGASVLLLPD